MKANIIKSIDKISRKRKIKYKYISSENIIGSYFGFNEIFSEFLDITIYLQQDNILIEVIPNITFEYINNFKTIDKINIIKTDGHKIKISTSVEFNIDETKIKLQELYDRVFSKKVIDYYFNLLIENYQNKLNKQ